jgi:hypothetical protein
MTGKGTECSCHLVDWTGGPGNYTVISTGERLNKDGKGDYDWLTENCICCQDKVNTGVMSMDTYLEICKYIPGSPGTKFPEEVYLQLLEGEEERRLQVIPEDPA